MATWQQKTIEKRLSKVIYNKDFCMKKFCSYNNLTEDYVWKCVEKVVNDKRRNGE